MEVKNKTVIMPLDEYEAMKQEIEELREEVKKKTIVKYYPDQLFVFGIWVAIAISIYLINK